MRVPRSQMTRCKWLAREDAKTIEERAERLGFLVVKFESYDVGDDSQLFPGGELAWQFFEEARWCFINGQFTACVVLCQCFLENTLRSRLGGFAPQCGITAAWLEKARFYDLIEKAREHRLITAEEATELHWVRKARIQYVHARPPGSKHHIAHRIVAEEMSVGELAANDAVRSICLMLREAQRPGF